MNKHYYTLPNGMTVDNMKDGCTRLSISSERFRAMVRSGRIVRVDNRAKASNDGCKV